MMFDSMEISVPRHPLEEEMVHEWRAFEVSKKHVGSTFDKILDAWNVDRATLIAAQQKIEELEARISVLEALVSPDKG